MKWIHQVDSSFSSIAMYSPTDHFVACGEAWDNYSYDMRDYMNCHVSADEIRKQLNYWLSRQNSDLVRVISATGELRRMFREIEPSLFL